MPVIQWNLDVVCQHNSIVDAKVLRQHALTVASSHLETFLQNNISLQLVMSFSQYQPTIPYLLRDLVYQPVLTFIFCHYFALALAPLNQTPSQHLSQIASFHTVDWYRKTLLTKDSTFHTVISVSKEFYQFLQIPAVLSYL